MEKVKREVATETGKYEYADKSEANDDSIQVKSTAANIGDISSILKNKDHFAGLYPSLTTKTLEHLEEIEIDEKTGNLWESAWSYIFHHLGRDT